MENKCLVKWNDVNLIKNRWKFCIKSSLENVNVFHHQSYIIKKEMSQRRFYKKLKLNGDYLNQNLKRVDIKIIAKARCDLLNLNGNKFVTNAETKCKICSENVEESLYHFMGICKSLREVRNLFFFK